VRAALFGSPVVDHAIFSEWSVTGQKSSGSRRGWACRDNRSFRLGEPIGLVRIDAGSAHDVRIDE